MALRILQEVGERRGVSTNKDAQVRKTLADRRKETRARVAQNRRGTLWRTDGRSRHAADMSFTFVDLMLETYDGWFAVTFVVYRREDEFPDAAQPAVELPLPGGQLVNG